ncbi:MAG: AlpA family phage regulatory protein [Colwellia sp.]
MKDFPRIVRRAEVLDFLQISRSNLYQKIDKSLWPAPIPLGARAVGWISSENETVIAAMISGQSQEQIKQLVQELMEQRKELFKGVS